MNARDLMLSIALIWCVAGCSSAPSVSASRASPDGKYLAEIVEVHVPEWDRRFEVRVTNQGTNNLGAKTIYRSPDEGHITERLLWSRDGRYLLLVGKSLAAGAECMTDTGEVIYLLYDVKTDEVRCNSVQLDIEMKHFDFKDLAGIDFGEPITPARPGTDFRFPSGS